jgi:transcriptional regulator with XRE-family HTH domain
MNQHTSPQNNFSAALRLCRKACNVSQEAFGVVSSRTYVSSLERGIKQPTLNKVDELAGVMGVHPLTLLAISYLDSVDPSAQQALMNEVSGELTRVLAQSATIERT